ncbi:MAG TPA: L,D-transpeptidase family protein [Phnomibacter sp.]|nr:L,D-transpeptidase family protein [Phnomibacter sp.]
MYVVLGLRRYSVISLSILVGIFLVACNMSAEKKPELMPVDTTINKENAYIGAFLDSAYVAQFLQGAKLSKADSAGFLSFYRDRNFQYAWFDSAGMTEQAYNFINLYTGYRQSMNDSVLYNAALDKAVEGWMEDSTQHKPERDEIASMEMLLSKQFFLYSEKAYGVNASIDLPDLGWFIPKKKLDPKVFLDSVVLAGGRDIQQLAPVHPMFEQLRKALSAYTSIALKYKFDSIAFAAKKYTVGDSAADIGRIKERLHILGDLPAEDSGNVYTKATAKGVKQFQQRMGIAADGVAGKSFFAELNTPIEIKIQKILINMERARWVPKPGHGAYIVVNIPDFKLRCYDSSHMQLELPVVVGKPASSTVIFNGNMKYVVFSPYWNLPYSIVKNEVKKNIFYYMKHRMQVVGRYSDGLPQLRQKPGPNNSLGRVKFLFPNSYNIYLHDTPSKSLFGETKRAFSHGCIRVGTPEKLAAWVLKTYPEWTTEKIEEAMNLDDEKTVTLSKPIPVFIGYFTCWVDANGKVNFRNDIYGHDKKLAEHLFHAQ